MLVERAREGTDIVPTVFPRMYSRRRAGRRGVKGGRWVLVLVLVRALVQQMQIRFDATRLTGDTRSSTPLRYSERYT